MEWWIISTGYCGIWNGGDIVEYGMVKILWIMEWWRYCGTWNSGYIVEQGMVEMLWNMEWWKRLVVRLCAAVVRSSSS